MPIVKVYITLINIASEHIYRARMSAIESTCAMYFWIVFFLPYSNYYNHNYYDCVTVNYHR